MPPPTSSYRTPGLSSLNFSSSPPTPNPASNTTTPNPTTSTSSSPVPQPKPSLSSRPTLSATAYATHGAALRSSHLDSLATQLSVFQSLLHQFSLTHAKEIRQNPSFRSEFARMCNAVGVDPLLSSTSVPSATSSGLGSKFGWLGGASGSGGGASAGGKGSKALSDFYNELALRIVETCRSLRAQNGGLTTLSDLRSYIALPRPGTVNTGLDVSEDDILQALSLLTPLSAGIAAVTIGGRTYIRSVPKELGGDQSKVLEVVGVLGWVSVGMLVANLGWAAARARTVVGDLVEDGLVWVDGQADSGEKEYWSPAFIADPDGGFTGAGAVCDEHI